MSKCLPYDDIKFDRNVKFEGIVNTPDGSEIWLFSRSLIIISR